MKDSHIDSIRILENRLVIFIPNTSGCTSTTVIVLLTNVLMTEK